MALNLAPIIPAIFTGPNGEVLSPEQIRDRQLIAQSLMGQATDTSPNAGGWASILAKGVQGFQAGRERRGADNAVAGNNTYNSDLLSSLLSGSSTSATSSPMASSAATSGVAQEMAATSPVDVSTNGDTFEPFIGTVKSAITNPYGLAAVASTGKAESGWSSGNSNRSWSDPSQSGQPGTAGGILSWRGPRLAALQSYASQKGEKGNGSPQTQAEFFLREDPKLVQTLNSAKSVEEAQSAINRAWAFAGYDKPGGEAGRRLQYARSYLPQLQGSTQVASASPAAAAIEAAAPTSGYVDPMVSTPAYVAPQASAPVTAPPIAQALLETPTAQSGFDAGRFGDAPAPSMSAPAMGETPEIYSAQSDFAPELPAPVNVAPAPAVASVQQPAAQPAQLPQAPSANTAIIAQALRVMGDPRANDGTRRVAQALLQQEQQKQQFAQEQNVWQQRQQYEQQQQNNDPLRQLQIRKAQMEVDGGSRQSLVNAGDGRIYDPNSQQWIQAPNSGQAKAPETQTFYDEQGREYRAQWNPTSSSWERVGGSKLPSGMTIRTNPDGTFELIQGQGSGGNLTEAQSKDAVYSTRARGALTTLDKFDTALTSLPERAAEYDPTGLSRSVQSPEFQQARQSGDEFLQAILRKDTGAAITSDEMASYGRTYLPAPGDGPELLAQKRVARSRALAALESGMPPQAILNQEKALEKSSKPETAQSDDIARAKAAIAKGANREAVIKRLRDAGIPTEGL